LWEFTQVEGVEKIKMLIGQCVEKIKMLIGQFPRIFETFRRVGEKQNKYKPTPHPRRGYIIVTHA
jgi:hypothetical protein